MGPLHVGYRFHPTEEELVSYYLKKKVMGQPLMGWDSEIIIERDLYGDEATPWELFRDDNEALPWQIVVESSAKVVQSQKILYVFTKLSTVGKNAKNKQKNRAAGCGSWHGTTATEDVRDNCGKGKIIGSKRTFTFSSQQETVGQWTMYEYSIDAAAHGFCPAMNCENYVLCRIKKDESKSSKGGRIVSRKRIANSRLNEVEWADVDEKRLGKKRKLDRSETSVLTMNEDAITSCQGPQFSEVYGVAPAGTSCPEIHFTDTIEEGNMTNGTRDDFGCCLGESMTNGARDDFRCCLGENGSVPYLADRGSESNAMRRDLPAFPFYLKEDNMNPNLCFDTDAFLDELAFMN